MGYILALCDAIPTLASFLSEVQISSVIQTERLFFMQRRSFLKLTAAAGYFGALGELGFLSRLPVVCADEAKLDPKVVRFHPEIEPLVRLLEETPRDRVLEEAASRIQRGLS